ncbi:MAG TPA: helix-turn-helix domain-containing protein [Mycobacteriales bacterium]|jgi:AcrR family transcriptional regulator|nr:helix-turn-helix domain-containing protein [Mycobacteriales bacterium]
MGAADETSPTAERPPRRRGGRQPTPLSLEDVTAAGVAVTARHGLEALTVRAVAAELGVTAPAVHYYIAGKRELVNRVCEEVASRIDLSVDPDASWIDQYVEIVLAMDRCFAQFPGVAARALASTGTSRAARRIADVVMGILRGAGFSQSDAFALYAAAQMLFTGWLVARGLSEEGSMHPSLQAAAGEQPVTLTVADLEYAVRRLVDGFDRGRG